LRTTAERIPGIGTRLKRNLESHALPTRVPALDPRPIESDVRKFPFQPFRLVLSSLRRAAKTSNLPRLGRLPSALPSLALRERRAGIRAHRPSPCAAQGSSGRSASETFGIANLRRASASSKSSRRLESKSNSSSSLSATRGTLAASPDGAPNRVPTGALRRTLRRRGRRASARRRLPPRRDPARRGRSSRRR
jgi:hypothetical protein